jgi:hypothetical protein
MRISITKLLQTLKDVGLLMTEEEEIAMREFTRNTVRLEVTVRTDGHRDIRGRSRELSMNGLFVMTCEQLKPGTRCHITLTLSDNETAIETDGHVANVHDAGMGIAFDEMEPESFNHLRKLVLFNAKDYELVEQELGNHVGFKNRIG